MMTINDARKIPNMCIRLKLKDNRFLEETLGTFIEEYKKEEQRCLTAAEEAAQALSQIRFKIRQVERLHTDIAADISVYEQVIKEEGQTK